MSLRDFVIRKESVAHRGGSTEVRGIALFDISDLMRNHLAEMNKLFAMYSNLETRDTAITQGMQFAARIVDEVPALVTAIIIRACDEDQHDKELVEHVQRFPIGMQVELIRKVIELTVEEAGGAKKLLDSLVTMVNTVKPTTETETD